MGDPKSSNPVEPAPFEPQPAVQPTPEVLAFAPDGGPASIGPDCRPIGAGNSHDWNSASRSLGTAQGPMQIGPDGRPVMPAQNAQGAPDANAQGAQGQAAQQGAQGAQGAQGSGNSNAIEIF